MSSCNLTLVRRSTELLSAESEVRVIGPLLACNELEVRRAAVPCHADDVDCFGSTLIPIDIMICMGYSFLCWIAGFHCAGYKVYDLMGCKAT
jgi:hypothetical protein